MHWKFAHVAVVVAGLALVASSPRAMATSHDMHNLQGKLPAGSPTVDCIYCHSGWKDEKLRHVKRSLSPFGIAYRKWKRSRDAAVSTLLDADSDGDGVPNEKELRLGANPGDRRNVPKAKDESELDRLDPAGRFTAQVERDEKSSSEDLRRQAAFNRFMLALLKGDAKALDDVIGSRGYQEFGQKEALDAPELLKEWRELGVSLPKGAALDSLYDPARTRFITPTTLRMRVKALERLPTPTQYAVLGPISGGDDVLKDPPILLMEKVSRRWRVVAGNVLSCWNPPGAATQPVLPPTVANEPLVPGEKATSKPSVSVKTVPRP